MTIPTMTRIAAMIHRMVALTAPPFFTDLPPLPARPRRQSCIRRVARPAPREGLASGTAMRRAHWRRMAVRRPDSWARRWSRPHAVMTAGAVDEDGCWAVTAMSVEVLG